MRSGGEEGRGLAMNDAVVVVILGQCPLHQWVSWERW